MKTLKYQKEVDTFSSCHLDKFQEQEERHAFRWVYEDINDSRNFLPIYQRFSDRPKTQCTGWSLSMYATQDKAKAKLEQFTKHKPLAYLRLGTHTAKGMLCADDGISDVENVDSRHFDHFEYPERDLASKFEIVEQVVVII